MLCVDFTDSDTDISFVSSGRPSSGCSSVYDYLDSGRTSRVSTSSDRSFGSNRLGLKFTDPSSPDTSFSQESIGTSFSYSSQNMVSTFLHTYLYVCFCVGMCMGFHLIRYQ